LQETGEELGVGRREVKKPDRTGTEESRKLSQNQSAGR